MTKLNKSLLRVMMDEVIISHRNGKPYLKRRPKMVNNPKTEQQTSQRGKFKAASTFVSRNLNVLIRPYWNPEAKRQGMTGQNLFCKTNTQAFDADGNPDFENLQASVGELPGIEQLRLSLSEDNALCLFWANNCQYQKSKRFNELKIFGINKSLEVNEFPCRATRETGMFALHFDEQNYTHLFLFFWNKEDCEASIAEWIEL